jgi:PPOX class probable F420-dependent enzyme
MDRREMSERLTTARVARLATVDRTSRPHIVPIVFAVTGDRVCSVIDDKPKRSKDLKRLRNIRADDRVTLLVDHYDEDWARLWWVRVDGSARIVASGEERRRAIALLGDKYPQYGAMPPDGPVIVITIEHLTGWSA